MVNLKTNQRRRATSGMVAVVATATLLAVGQTGASATHLTVNSVAGRAFGYWADEMSLFNGAQADAGPSPTVTLAADASNSRQDATAPCAGVAYGPANVFTSDDLTVGTAGSLGTTGSVTSTSSIANINKRASTACSGATGSEIFGYPPQEPPGSIYINFNPNNLSTSVSGTATSGTSGVSGSTTITNGMVRTHKQASEDCNATTPPPFSYTTTLCGRAGEQHVHSSTDPEGVVTIPTNPPPNYVVAGHLHIGLDTTDKFVIVFNEQITNPDGSIIVTPVHEYFGYKLVNGQIVKDLPYDPDPAKTGSVLHGHLYLGRVVAGPADAVTDFDGNGGTDRSVFRNGAWYTDGQSPAFLGVSGDIAVPADYDGDHKDDRAVYRNGAWYTEGQPTATYLGVSTDIPVPGDYNGDGKDERAVFRPSVGGWYIEGQSPIFFGVSSDIPVPADYDGNGTTDVGIWRPSVGGWYINGQIPQFIGLNGDIPVPGDYDGNGSTDRGIWRPSVGGWYIAGQTTQFVGLSGDIPVPGDYDRNGSTDRGIWRRSVGGWYVQGQTTVFLGLSTDIPLPLPNAIYRKFF